MHPHNQHHGPHPHGPEDPQAGSLQPRAPRLVFWETTEACNLACIHCRRLADSIQANPEQLSTAEAIGMIDQLAKAGCMILVFSGGEPLMRPDLFELLEHARDRHLMLAVASNGTLINDAVAQRLAGSGVRRVSISLDGPDAVTHDSFRRIDGSFEAALGAIANLRQAGIGVQINTTVATHNHLRLQELYELAGRIGAEALHFFMLVPVGCGVELSESMTLSPQRYEGILNWIYEKDCAGDDSQKSDVRDQRSEVRDQRSEVRGQKSEVGGQRSEVGSQRSEVGSQKSEVRLRIKATCAPHYMRVWLQRRKAAGLPMQRGDGSMYQMSRGCLAGTEIVFVSHRGEVFPCGYLPVPAGNLRTQSFKVIWEGSQVLKAFREPVSLHGKCGTCEYMHVCLGCRARAYAGTGDLLAEEPCCLHQPRLKHKTEDV